MIKIMAILIGVFVFSRPVFAADETVEAPPSSAVDEKIPDAATQLRDPFWPIGYTPPLMPGRAVIPSKGAGSGRDKEAAAQPPSLAGMLRIGGVIRKGNKFYVTINGFTVQTGEVVTAVADGEVYKFIVEGIGFRKVQLKPVKR